MFKELNKDQLSALSNLLFDVAKGAFALAVLPVADPSLTSIQNIFRSIVAILGGVVFMWLGLLLLRLKRST